MARPAIEVKKGIAGSVFSAKSRQRIDGHNRSSKQIPEEPKLVRFAHNRNTGTMETANPLAGMNGAQRARIIVGANEMEPWFVGKTTLT